jgi:hypothetical protein
MGEKVKKFGEFMSTRKYGKGLSFMDIKGQTKRNFFQKSTPFEIRIYYTPIKKIILDIILLSNNIDLKNLNLTFRKGDNIEVVREWIIKNNYEIVVEIDREKY